MGSNLLKKEMTNLIDKDNLKISNIESIIKKSHSIFESQLSSSELTKLIILLIHSTAAISAKAKLIKPNTATKKDHLYLKVYPSNLLKLPVLIFL